MIRFRHFLFAALLAASSSSFAAQTVMVFGDSLSAAYNLSVQQGWVHLVSRRIEAARLPWRVVNASVTGETATGGLRRIAEDLRRHKPDVVVIELGGNDALRGQPIAGIRDNLEQIVRLVKQARAEPVLVGMRIPPNYGIDYAVQFQDMYASLAKKANAPLVPFLLEGIAEKPDLFMPDQIHPVAAAQPRIAENVWAVLEPVLKKKSK